MIARLLICCYLLAISHFVVGQSVRLATTQPWVDYSIGEEAVFVFDSEMTGEATYRIRYQVSGDILEEGTFQHSGGTTQIRYAANKPTFIVCEVELNGQGVIAPATFSRNEIAIYAEEPVDYDAFWLRQKAELAQIPLDVQQYKLKETNYSTTYKFSLAQIDGRRVYGYLTIPKGEGPFPASLRLPSFGASPNLVRPDETSAERANCIAFSISIHDVPPDQQDPNAYKNEDLSRPEGFYYRYAVLAAIRTLDYLESLPVWNKKDLILIGTSQGGGLAFLTAGIDDRPTLLVQSVAALSQHHGYLHDQPSGFPYYLQTADVLGDPTYFEQVVRASRYYETGFAARRFTGPSLHYVNYLDPVCPPATHYAARNATIGPKVTLHSLFRYHNNAEEVFMGKYSFIREHIPATRVAPFPNASKQRGHFVEAGDYQLVNRMNATLQGSYGIDQFARTDWTASWTQVGGPPSTITQKPRGRAEVNFSEEGIYKFRLDVTDPYPAVASRFYTLTDYVTVEVEKLANSTISTSEALQEKVTIFPNPLVGDITIETSIKEPIIVASIHSIMGQEMQQLDVNRFEQYAGGQGANFMIEALPAGIYYVHLSTEVETYDQQVIVVE